MPRALRAPRRQAPAAERRSQILEAALRCFARRGYHAATMDELARDARLSKGSLYWHFESKEQVFLALFDAFVADIFAAWERAAERGGSALDLLRGQGEIVLERMAAQVPLLHAWAEFLSHRAARERFAAAYRQTRRKLGEWVRRGIERGEIRALPVESVAALATASVEGLLLQAMVDPDFDPKAHWPVAWEVVRRGLAP